MSGELEGLLVILCLNTIYAYGVFLPAASGQLNLGAAGFITLGAYCSAFVNSELDGLGVSAWMSIPIAVLFTAAVSFLIAFPILRTRGVYMVLATFAFAEVVAGLIINLEFLGAAQGMPVDAHMPFYGLAIVTLLVALFCHYLMATRCGLAMRAIHDDESVATLFGANVRMIRVWAFATGGALMGLGGALYGHHFNYVEAQNFNILLSIYILLYVLLGGTQTAWGPVVGALFFTFVPELFRYLGRETGEKWLEDGRFVAFGLIIVIMMVIRPEGVVTRTLLERITGGRRRQPASPAAAE
ncbi:MAG: branched-chain amino acid ABC transporter permease [Rhodospirillaceae bacterium]|nr:branched-chain amino acid ABC transporter permease [Rhodospirillaceae bacterium]MCY4237035.1 branched-chain amino acid ABC transporter permease [Rhodospirillaceae bacterium]